MDYRVFGAAKKKLYMMRELLPNLRVMGHRAGDYPALPFFIGLVCVAHRLIYVQGYAHIYFGPI